MSRHACTCLRTAVGSTRSSWSSAAAVAIAERAIPSEALIHTPAGPAAIADPLRLVGKELGALRQNVQQLLGSRHPALDNIAKYYFHAEGKHIRPLVVLLMAQATNGLSPEFHRRQLSPSSSAINESLEPLHILNDDNPSLQPDNTPDSSSVLPTQRRLAEITEMIHVASLLHDDVIDNASTRRSTDSAPAAFGNKLSILGGDFLLARASLALSRLGSNEVVELVASVLANLVEGEVMQMQGNTPIGTKSITSLTPEIFQHYMRKTYLKTASLIAKSARATVILGGCGKLQGWEEGESIKDAAYSYGRNLGIAFQLVDDLLDFTSTSNTLGKPGQGADLKLGLATAPALYAWEEHPSLGELIHRKFSQPGDVEQARHFVQNSSGPEKTQELARHHVNLAKEALQVLPESEARTALEQLTAKVLDRKK